jgi:hypothetical protein
MKLALAVALVSTLSTASAVAQQKKPEPAAAIKKDIADHRTMAQAHEIAAKCLEAGKSEKECHDQLAKDCGNVAIGRYCGMRHRH